MDLFEKYLTFAYNFLSYRIRSEKEMRLRLKAKNAPPEIIELIIDKLNQQKFLNDENFARVWIESRSRLKPRSHYLLKRELIQKGIKRELVEKIIREQNTNNTDKAIPSDLSLAKKLVIQKLKKYKLLNKSEQSLKLIGVLARRGFSWDISKAVVADVLNNEENDTI